MVRNYVGLLSPMAWTLGGMVSLFHVQINRFNICSNNFHLINVVYSHHKSTNGQIIYA
jgi:hypothetical protein